MKFSESEMTIQSSWPFKTQNIGEGEILFREGDLTGGIYFVQSGCIKMVVNRNQTRGRTTSPEYVTKLVGPGEFFGYKSVIKKISSSATAKAVKDSVVYFYSKELVLNELQKSHSIFGLILNQAINDLETYEVNSQLHYLASVQERIAYQLVLLMDKFGVETPSGISLNLKLTRNEFAQLASTINESLSRHLTEFKAAGFIDLNGKEIVIKDRRALMQKSGNFNY